MEMGQVKDAKAGLELENARLHERVMTSERQNLALKELVEEMTEALP